jgi:integrase
MSGQLISRGDRKWQIKIFQGRQANGRRQYYSKTVHGTKKEAQRFLNEKLHARDTGRLLVPSTRTVQDFLLEWVDTGKPGISARTRASYREILLRYVIPELGPCRLDY